MDYTINVHGQLMALSQPQVMGILNVTPDSFFAGSRMQTEQAIAGRANQIVAEGATMIDVGGCSTRPGSEPVSEAEEMQRLRLALGVVRREQPHAVVSVDTFRPDVARMAVEEFGADIINDVSEGSVEMYRMIARLRVPWADIINDVSEGSVEMYRMIARLRVPYILMSVQPNLRDMLLAFAREVQQLRDFGVKDIILDPGFGFGKTVAQNYSVMNQLERLHESLNGTSVLNTIALMKGASILRVHDVKEAVECVRIVESLNGQIDK